MKVRVVLTVEVDPIEWDILYGTGYDELSRVREDVHLYVLRQVAESAAAQEGAILNVKEVR